MTSAIKDGKKVQLGQYGCHNRPPMRKSLMVQDGWTPDGRRNMVEIPFAMSTNCRHDKTLTDSRCAGCLHAKGLPWVIPTSA